MAYIHFTDEQKQRANSVDLVDFLQRQGEQLVRSGREWRWKRYDSVTVRGSEWFRHSRKEGGRAIDFVQQFYDMSFPDAVSFLLGGEGGVEWNQTEKSAPPPRKAFVLPEANPDMRRVFAYLIKQRFIDREVLSHFARERLIYEDSQYHNAVFVGLDENGVARHAYKRGTYTRGEAYKGNVEGSDPRYSFHWIGKGRRIYVFEAPIDMLSFITLHLKDWKHHSYVTLDGVSEHAMLQQLRQNPDLQEIIFCLDHDEAGIEASGRLEDILCQQDYYDPEQMKTDILQSKFKDWNEDLKARHGITPIPPQEHPRLVLLPQICSQLLDICHPDSVKKEPSIVLMEQLERLKAAVTHEIPTARNRAYIIEELQLTVSIALLFIQSLCRQMEMPVSLEQLTARLQSEYKPHKDRGWIRTKAEDIQLDIQDITRRFQANSVRTMDEQTALMNSCLKLALDCVKAQMFLVLERPLQRPIQEQGETYMMTM